MKLLCLRGSRAGQEWAIGQSRLVIGRDVSCDISLADPKISRYHAEFVHQDGLLVFRDCNSTNGSTVNNFRVTEQAVYPGDRIRVGDSELTVAEDHIVEEEFGWDESKPVISATIRLDQALAAASPDQDPEFESRRTEHEPAEQPEQRLLGIDLPRVEKRLANLQALYRMTRAMTRIMALDDLYSLLERMVFEAFPEVERICLLQRDEGGELRPAMLRTRDGRRSDPFTISRSILKFAENEKLGILASDAAADTRFRSSDSIIRHHVRSALCAPLVHQDRVIGALYLDNRRRVSCFDNEDLALLTAFAGQVAVSLQNALLYENIQRAYHQAILALVNTLEARDPYTIGHTQRTMRYALGLGQEMGLNRDALERLRMAAQLHDIGKISLDEQLLAKPGSLTDSEVAAIQNHVMAGEKILQPIEYLRDIIPIILGHHERHDGSGYPQGLKGDEILLESRILAVADAFDAMTTQRPYNKPLSFREAVQRCREAAGAHFDPVVVEALGRFLEANYESTSRRERLPSDAMWRGAAP